MLKIAVLKKDYDQWGGGAERYAVNACSRLAKRGHQVVIFSESFSCDPVENLTHHQVPRVVTDGFSRTTSFHRRVQKVVDPQNFDLVYALSRTYPSDVFRVAESIEAKCLQSRPLNERINPRHTGIKRLEAQLYDTAKTGMVVTNARLTKNQILEFYDYPEERIRVIRNGIDRKKFFPADDPSEVIAFRRELGISDDTFAMMFAAANFKSKGLEYAIRGMAALGDELKQRSILMVLGDYNPDFFRKLAFKLGIGELVRFEGKNENMRDYYLAADIFFYPTIYEPCANVCLEALSCGLPVLTTTLNGAAELIEHEVNGYVVPDFQCRDEMVTHLHAFAELSLEQRKYMIEKTSPATLECDWEEHVSSLERLFESVVSEKRNRKK